MSITAEQAVEVFRASDCLHDEVAVGDALDAMATDIRSALAGKDAVALVVMNGGFITAAGLLLRLDLPLRIDYLHATRYRERTSGGLLDWKRHHEVDIAGRDVLVIDDILWSESQPWPRHRVAQEGPPPPGNPDRHSGLRGLDLD